MTKIRSITPNDPADFTPELGNYKSLQPFRYWCQKVLPLVYDNTLSYYELLCKVVDYLNKTMQDVDTLHGDVTNIHEAYDKLQTYVNDYFSTLDVQEEINNKLDEMASDGTLLGIITPFLNNVSAPIFVESTGAMTNPSKIYVLSTNGHIYYYNGSSFIDSSLTYGVNSLYFTGGSTNRQSSTELADMNNALPNRAYIFDNASTLNLPYNGFRGIVLTFDNNEDLAYQYQVAYNFNNRRYERIYNGTNWTKWFDANNPLYFMPGSVSTEADTVLTDLNDALPNRTYIFDRASTLNLPYNGFRGIVLTFDYNEDKAYQYQIAVDLNNDRYERLNIGGGVWSAWKNNDGYEVIYLSTANDIYNAFKSGKSNVIYNIEPGTYDLYTELIENDILSDTPYETWFGDNVIINGCNSEINCYIPSNIYTAHQNACLNSSIIHTRYNCKINDLTIRIKNMRYCIHDESSTIENCYYTEHYFNNLKLYAETDSSAYTRPIGIGGSKGQKYIFNNCHFDYNIAFYIHGRDYNIGEITFNYCTAGYDQVINLSQYTSNDVPTNVNINNCKFKTVTVSSQSGGSKTLQYAIKAINCGTISIIKGDDNTYIEEPVIINNWE